MRLSACSPEALEANAHGEGAAAAFCVFHIVAGGVLTFVSFGLVAALAL